MASAAVSLGVAMSRLAFAPMATVLATGPWLSERSLIRRVSTVPVSAWPQVADHMLGA
jgi:hypothetical protein